MVNTKTDDDQQPMSDDQELAKVLAGVTGGVDAGVVADEQTSALTAEEKAAAANAEAAAEAAAPQPEPVAAPAAAAPAAAGGGELEAIKKDAIIELRPLVDKLNLAPEEKFDTYLLLLRSTDDKELIAPAHEAARGIADEARRAQALLDVIKEIDFLSGNAPAA